MARTRHLMAAIPLVAPISMALLMNGCENSERARRAITADATQQSSEAQTKPAPPSPLQPAAITSVPTQDPAVPARWDEDMAVARAVGEGGHLKAVMAGIPFAVKDPVAGTTRNLGIPQTIVDSEDKPVAWPVAPGHGFVPTTTQDEASGETVILHFELVWDPTKERLNGRMGMFQAVGYELAEVGDDVRHRYEQQGEFWVRRTGATPPSPTP